MKDEIIKELEGGKVLSIQRMLFQKFRLYLGEAGSLSYDDGW